MPRTVAEARSVASVHVQAEVEVTWMSPRRVGTRVFLFA